MIPNDRDRSSSMLVKLEASFGVEAHSLGLKISNLFRIWLQFGRSTSTEFRAKCGPWVSCSCSLRELVSNLKSWHLLP